MDFAICLDFFVGYQCLHPVRKQRSAEPMHRLVDKIDFSSFLHAVCNHIQGRIPTACDERINGIFYRA